MAATEFELLGDLLLRAERATKHKVEEALTLQKRVRKRLGEILIDLKAVTEDDLVKTLSEQLSIPVAGREALLTADPDLARLVPEPFAREYFAIPLRRTGNAIEAAMEDPENPAVADQLKKLLGAEIRPLLAGRTAIVEALNRVYDTVRKSGEVDTVLSGLEFELKDDAESGVDMDLLRKEIDDAPIVKLVNLLLHEALKERATDIHIEPGQAEMAVRYRIDGALQEVMRAPLKSHHGVVSRIKIMSKLNIAESRLPQDGRFTIRLPDREVDVRVSILPSGVGEKIVLRLLDKVSFDFRLENLGFEPADRVAFERCIRKPYGIIIISGPTGSGKSTTLYSAIREIKSSEDNIVTVEDPVEYQMDGITQVAVNDKIGLSFGNTLRSVLRQDPDKILIGEIRDEETADIAMKFALTGHLVFTTLHANDAASTLTRLVDIGVEPFLVGSSLVLVMAQRLIRKICAECKAETAITEKEHLLLDLPAADRKRPVFKGKGCARCRHTGYFGRTGIFEIMPLTPGLRQLVFRKADQDAIRAAAVKEGMKTLRGSALEKLFAGVTSVHEVLKTTVAE